MCVCVHITQLYIRRLRFRRTQSTQHPAVCIFSIVSRFGRTAPCRCRCKYGKTSFGRFSTDSSLCCFCFSFVVCASSPFASSKFFVLTSACLAEDEFHIRRMEVRRYALSHRRHAHNILCMYLCVRCLYAECGHFHGFFFSIKLLALAYFRLKSASSISNQQSDVLDLNVFYAQKKSNVSLNSSDLAASVGPSAANISRNLLLRMRRDALNRLSTLRKDITAWVHHSQVQVALYLLFTFQFSHLCTFGNSI